MPDDEDEDDVTAEFETFDEAYAALMASLPVGGTVSLHDETCSLVDDESECDCSPLVITKGAEA